MTELSNVVIGDRGYKVYESVVVALSAGAATITLDVDPADRHWFAGIVYYSDAEGDTVVLNNTTGTALIKIKNATQPQGFQDPQNNSLDATLIIETDWSGNTLQVKADIASVDVATHARLIVSGNLS